MEIMKDGFAKFNMVFRGRQQWASTHCVYTHGIGVPLRLEGCALCYHIYTRLA